MLLGDVCACITAYCRRTHGFVAHAGRPAGVKCPRGDSIRLLFPGRRARPPSYRKAGDQPLFSLLFAEGQNSPAAMSGTGSPDENSDPRVDICIALRCVALRVEASIAKSRFRMRRGGGWLHMHSAERSGGR